MADQDVEEVAEELWTLGEQDRRTLADLEQTSQVALLTETVDTMIVRGLIRLAGDRVELTAAGRELAEQQVRRHRLAEMLFTAVLRVDDDRAVNRTACVMEHVLDAAMTESVCAFLGHPRHCPHGKPIPEGRCCRSFSAAIQPAVQPLTRLTPGQSACIVHIVAREPGLLVRLAALGLVPGASVVLAQRRPTAVVRVGETTLAIETSLADEIYVKRVA
jgi:DtxR family Mn-dependent transcriptional regulator